MLVEAIRSPEVVQLAQSFKMHNKNIESSSKPNAAIAPVEQTVVHALESGKAVQAAASISEAVTARTAVPDNTTESARYLQIEEARRSVKQFTADPQKQDENPAKPGALSRKVNEATRSFVDNANEQRNIFLDEATGQMGMRVIDKDTGEVLRQIPPQELLRMMARLRESIGAFIDHQS
jgi:flagellar protein FlaG